VSTFSALFLIKPREYVIHKKVGTRVGRVLIRPSSSLQSFFLLFHFFPRMSWPLPLFFPSSNSASESKRTGRSTILSLHSQRRETSWEGHSDRERKRNSDLRDSIYLSCLGLLKVLLPKTYLSSPLSHRSKNTSLESETLLCIRQLVVIADVVQLTRHFPYCFLLKTSIIAFFFYIYP